MARDNEEDDENDMDGEEGDLWGFPKPSLGSMVWRRPDLADLLEFLLPVMLQ